MTEETLFELPEREGEKPEVRTRPEDARVLRPVHNQLEWAPQDLESMLADDHPARAIWAMLERLDLSAFYACIKAVIGACPQMLRFLSSTIL